MRTFRLPVLRLSPWMLLTACMVGGGLAGAGCGPATRSVQVTVANEAERPVVAWLAKEGQPYEMHWLTPAQFAIMHKSQPPDREEVPAVLIRPGERAGIGPRSGKFDREALPVLYVYSAPVTLAEMAATERRSPLRDIVPLNEGENFVTVTSTTPVRAQRLRRQGEGEGMTTLGAGAGDEQ